MTMSTDADVAEACGLLSVIDAVIVHVPASTNATSPDDELIVHTEVVELEYDFVPTPAEAVDVIVGFVATSNAYGVPEYDAASIVSVRVVSDVIVIEIEADVEAEYVSFPASSARIVHVPAFVELAVRVDPAIEQYKVPVSTVNVVVPAVPAESVVLRFAVPDNDTVEADVTAVTVRSDLPVVKLIMSP